MLKRKDLLGLIDATEAEITEILDLAQDFKNRIKRGEKRPRCRTQNRIISKALSG